MPNTMLGTPDLNFVNSRKAVADMGGSGSSLGNASNYLSITAIDARLTAANAAYYTAERLNQLTLNDKVFALRNIDDATTIASYMTNSAA